MLRSTIHAEENALDTKEEPLPYSEQQSHPTVPGLHYFNPVMLQFTYGSFNVYISLLFDIVESIDCISGGVMGCSCISYICITNSMCAQFATHSCFIHTYVGMYMFLYM